MALISSFLCFLVVSVFSEAKTRPESKLYFSIPLNNANAGPRPSLFRPRPIFIPLPIAIPQPVPPPPPPPPAIDTSPAGQKAAQQDALKSHNQYREKHHSPAMKLDDDLNAMALKCAEYYAKQQKIDHTCPHRSNTVGENLAGGQGSWDIKSATTKWYNEVGLYDFNNPGYKAPAGHFSQVVWKESDKLGYALATYNGYTAVVAIYSPGQTEGKFVENVLKA